MSKRFITYFQSVITIGIMNKAENKEEALEQAKKAFKTNKELNHCYLDQTNFTQSGDVQEWSSPEPVAVKEASNIKFTFEPTEEMLRVMAIQLNKSVAELSDEDYANCIKEDFNNIH